MYSALPNSPSVASSQPMNVTHKNREALDVSGYFNPRQRAGRSTIKTSKGELFRRGFGVSLEIIFPMSSKVAGFQDPSQNGAAKKECVASRNEKRATLHLTSSDFLARDPGLKTLPCRCSRHIFLKASRSSLEDECSSHRMARRGSWKDTVLRSNLETKHKKCH